MSTSPYEYEVVYGKQHENLEEYRAAMIVACHRRIQKFNTGHYDGPSRTYRGGPPRQECLLCQVETNEYSRASFSNKSKVICRKCRIHISKLEPVTDEVDAHDDGYDSEEEGKLEDAMRPKDEFDRFTEAVLAGQTETVFKRFVPGGSFIPVSRIKHEYLHSKDLEESVEGDRLDETLTVEEYEALDNVRNNM